MKTEGYMTGVEIATLTISLVSLSISIFVGYRTHAFGEYQLRLGTRNDFQKLLIDVDKTLVENPQLWAIYDAYPASGALTDIEKGRLRAFAYMLLNVFECVFAFYGDSPRLTKAENESFEAWKGFLKNTLQDSSFARELLANPKLRLIYHSKLIAEIDLILGSPGMVAKTDLSSATK
ncbi:MAG TPA: hypothetical protein VNO50_07845 [Pyrinomonadaceae bacterium]|nr:hypothetical protein [Pyrinomonadaceae bacterium]